MGIEKRATQGSLKQAGGGDQRRIRPSFPQIFLFSWNIGQFMIFQNPHKSFNSRFFQRVHWFLLSLLVRFVPKKLFPSVHWVET
jgi:hypothetical protein